MLGGIFEENNIKEKINKFNKKILETNFWNDKLSAQKILHLKRLGQLQNRNINLNLKQNQILAS